MNRLVTHLSCLFIWFGLMTNAAWDHDIPNMLGCSLVFIGICLIMVFLKWVDENKKAQDKITDILMKEWK